MGENVAVKAKRVKDADGRIVKKGEDFTLSDCVITPQGKIDVYTEDVAGGNVLELQVLYPAYFPDIGDDTEVIIRGISYKTKFPSWDYNLGRTPWLSFHQPRKIMIVERVES